MEKIKPFINNWTQSEKGKDILIILIIILVGLGCFELGKLSDPPTQAGEKIEYPNQGLPQDNTNNADTTVSFDSVQANTKVLTASSGTAPIEKNFFASSRGSKYYSLNCSGGKTIKQENKIYFATGEEAQKAGYTLSSSCK